MPPKRKNDDVNVFQNSRSKKKPSQHFEIPIDSHFRNYCAISKPDELSSKLESEYNRKLVELQNEYVKMQNQYNIDVSAKFRELENQFNDTVSDKVERIVQSHLNLVDIQYNEKLQSAYNAYKQKYDEMIDIVVKKEASKCSMQINQIRNELLTVIDQLKRKNHELLYKCGRNREANSSEIINGIRAELNECNDKVDRLHKLTLSIDGKWGSARKPSGDSDAQKRKLDALVQKIWSEGDPQSTRKLALRTLIMYIQKHNLSVEWFSF